MSKDNVTLWSAYRPPAKHSRTLGDGWACWVDESIKMLQNQISDLQAKVAHMNDYIRQLKGE